MPRRLSVVRVVVPNVDDPMRGSLDALEGPFLECLRYAGLVILHRDDESGRCFDILPPRGYNAAQSAGWAERNAARMSSFGYNAVKAPEWPNGMPKGVTPETRVVDLTEEEAEEVGNVLHGRKKFVELSDPKTLPERPPADFLEFASDRGARFFARSSTSNEWSFKTDSESIASDFADAVNRDLEGYSAHVGGMTGDKVLVGPADFEDFDG